ncbi:MAG: hypothetical protein HPY69_13170 [Armatimonadetes bacterium]|nr:hypothetical protein [Armatimonadota bacterium]
MGIVMVVAVAGVMGAAQANIIGNCCYTLTKYNILTEYPTHQGGACTYVQIEDGATWTPGTCNLQSWSYYCNLCGHTHTNERYCIPLQDRCSIEKEHECGANFHTGTAIKCHKRCQVSGCYCEGSGQPPHMVGP